MIANKDIARRTEVGVVFGGTVISDRIMTDLISLEYVDAEEDQSDDLTIKVADRDGVWVQSWLPDLISKAAETTKVPAASTSSVSTYEVTASIGLNVRSGPGTGYSRIGGLPYGTRVNVERIENSWATIKHNGKTAYISALYIKPISAGGGTTQTVRTKVEVQAVITMRNWNSDGKDSVLQCGAFELDDISADGPPATVKIKCTALPFVSTIRQTQKSRGWESYRLSGISQEIARLNGMGCMFLSDADPFYERVEQYREPDIAFLSRLCHDAGLSLKSSNNMLILFDQRGYERNPPAFTIRKGNTVTEGNATPVLKYTKYRLSSGKADTEYQSCRVRYTNPANGSVISGTAYVDDYKADDDKNQQLEITAKVSSAAEAKTLAEKHLRLHNKFQKSATFTLPGNVAVVAGITVMLEDWGLWNGKYIVAEAKHTVSSSGYITTATLRRVLEGY